MSFPQSFSRFSIVVFAISVFLISAARVANDALWPTAIVVGHGIATTGGFGLPLALRSTIKP
jgi:hypothetical protein